MKKVPYFDEQLKQTEPFNDWLILAGDQAMKEYRYNEINWQNKLSSLKIAPKAPVVLDTRELSTLNRLHLAPKEQKAVLIIQAGKLDEGQKNAICHNLAINTQASMVGITDLFSYETENVSDYIQRLRNDETAREAAEITANATQQQRPLKRIEEHSDGFRRGLYLFEIKQQNGQEYESVEFLSSPLAVIGLGVDYDEEKEHYTLLKWKASGDKSEIIEALPNCDIGYQEGWRTLAKKGLDITLRGRLRIELAEHIQQKSQFSPRWEITSKSGWKNGAYIMPNGDIIGDTNSQTPLFLRVKAEKAQYYTQSGNLADWQDKVARYAVGNSMILLAIACGLAAPIIGILNAANFGLHLYTNSSSGKTISSKLGASLYGHGKLTLSSWKGTDNGIVNEAISHNDGFLVMDELTQIDPKHGKDIAYALFNGEDKTRAKADGGNRKKRNWNVLVLSTGEKDLETQLSDAKIHVKAGELVRLINIPFERYQCFHEFANNQLSTFEQGKHFAETIEKNSERYYGTAGREWIAYLAEHQQEIKEAFVTYNQQWTDNLPKDKKVSNQIGRIARNFAVLETACQCSRHITGWTETQIRDTLQHVFNLWIDSNGYEDRETGQIIETLDSFLSQNLHRFHRKDKNGFIIEASNPAGAFIEEPSPHYYLFPAVLKEIFTHYQDKHVLKVLEEKGRLVKKEEGRNVATIPRDYQRGGYKRAYYITLQQDETTA